MSGEPESANPPTGKGTDRSHTAGPKEITRLLAAWGQGDRSALEKLTPLVYAELQRLAHGYLRGQRPGQPLQTTELVHEVYLRLAGQEKPNFNGRAHFMAVAARAMRQILVDQARTWQRQKRGGGAERVELDEGALIRPEATKQILDVNEALDRLAELDPRKAQVVELKYFGGLNHDEIAEVLKISGVTVGRDWVFSKAWLYAELQGDGHKG